MPSYMLVPLIVLVAIVVGAYALAPIIWLTRSARALELRRVSGRKILVWWCVAAIPWVITLLAIHSYQHVSLSVNGVLELTAALVVTLVLISLLVSLPLGVIVFSVLWKLDRNKSVGVRAE